MTIRALLHYDNNYTHVLHFAQNVVKKNIKGGHLVYSAIYGIIEEPRDFASYLLAIFIVNLLMYFAFYIIMKV